MNDESLEGPTRPPPIIYDPLLQGPAWFVTHPARTAVKTEPNVPSDVVPVKQEPLEVPASAFCSVSPDEYVAGGLEAVDPLSHAKRLFKPDPSPCKLETPPGETDAPNNDPCNSPLSSCQEDTDLPPLTPSTQSQTLPFPDLSRPLEELHRPSPPDASCHPPDTTPLVSIKTGTGESIRPPLLPAVTRSAVPRVIPHPVHPKPSNTSLQPCYVRLERLRDAAPTVSVKRRSGRSTTRTKESVNKRRGQLLRSTSHKGRPGKNHEVDVLTGSSTNQIPDQSTSISKRKIVKDDISSIVRLSKIPASHNASINRPTRDGSPMEVDDEPNSEPNSPADEPDSPTDEPDSPTDEPDSPTDEPDSPARPRRGDEASLGRRKKPACNAAKSFKCNNCSRFFKRRHNLKRHQLALHGIQPKPYFHCELCSRYWKVKTYLDAHICKDKSLIGYKCDRPTCGKVLTGRWCLRRLRIHLENHRIASTLPKVFSCPTCQRKCENERSLELHQRRHKNVNNFKCDKCSQVFKHKGNLTNHILAHIKPRLYSCATCSKGFNKKMYLVTHMRVHTELRPFPCADCDKRFKSHQELSQHVLVHNPDRPFRCSVCDKGFKRQNDVNNHEQVMHFSDEKAPNYPCPTCGKVFKKPLSLKNHLPTHTARRDFVCKECSKGFKTSYGLQYHMISHSDARPYKCSECDKAFKTKGDMKKHKVIHSSDEPFACEVCSRTFKYRLGLKYHVLTHIDEHPYACTECDQRFKFPSSLKMHLKRHGTEKRFACYLCTRGFHAKSDLAIHVALCLTKPHKCKPCALGFRTADELGRHLATHGKEKPKSEPGERCFKCDKCGWSFVSKFNLATHCSTVHVDGKPHSCELCDKSYKSQSGLKKHCLVSHPHETLNLKDTS